MRSKDPLECDTEGCSRFRASIAINASCNGRRSSSTIDVDVDRGSINLSRYARSDVRAGEPLCRQRIPSSLLPCHFPDISMSIMKGAVNTSRCGVDKLELNVDLQVLISDHTPPRAPYELLLAVTTVVLYPTAMHLSQY